MARKGFEERGYPKRGSPRRQAGKLMLIVCEGDETEPNYLNDLRVERRLPAERIRIIPSRKAGCTDPKGLVSCAKAQRRQFQREVGTSETIETWCVFDRDAHASFLAALAEARDADIQVAWSNPCFELWLLLHFRDQTAHIERDACRHLLKHGPLPGYEKAERGVLARLAVLGGAEADAGRRAGELRKMQDRNGNDEWTNPATNVDVLVGALRTIP